MSGEEAGRVIEPVWAIRVPKGGRIDPGVYVLLGLDDAREFATRDVRSRDKRRGDRG